MPQRRAQRVPDDAAGQGHVGAVHRLAGHRRVHISVLRAPAQRGAAEPAAVAGRGLHEGAGGDGRPTGGMTVRRVGSRARA